MSKAKAGSRKLGRNLKKCLRYRSEGREEKNKLLLQMRIIKRQHKCAAARERRLLREALTENRNEGAA